MSVSLDHIAGLIIKHLRGKLNAEERRELNAWAEEKGERTAMLRRVEEERFVPELMQDIEKGKAQSSAILRERGYPVGAERVAGDFEDVVTPVVHRVHFLRKAWFRYAAAVLFIIGVGSVVWVKWQRSPAEMGVRGEAGVVEGRGVQVDIQPGGNKAVLTLAGGEKIQLDSSANTYLAEHGITNRNSVLSYSWPTSIISMNMLATPRGGQYKLQLSDGTNVWLNAASSIRYPTSFTGSERQVSITGEAYFEVAKNAKKPFIVKTTTDIIQVLGTSFNVNAYGYENMVKTSLLEGSVKIGNVVLKPGEALTGKQVAATNADQDVAWKNGFFNFDKVSLQQAMRQIADWYDIEVIYEKDVPEIIFGGKMRRDMKLSQVLKFMKKMGVQFKTEGRRLIVTQ